MRFKLSVAIPYILIAACITGLYGYSSTVKSYSSISLLNTTAENYSNYISLSAALIVIICLAAMVVFLRYKNKRTQQEEQKKLGIELHDNLAGSLAAIKMQLEATLLDVKDTEIQEKILSISKQVATIYTNTRNKSHQLYKVAEKQELSFAEQVSIAMDNILPANSFKKELLLDDAALQKLSQEQQTGILSIIREAAINIGKHACATAVTLMIQEAFNSVVVKIADNGKGFKQPAKTLMNGIGMKSITQRTALLHANLNITTGNTGTELTITIPGKLHLRA